jgi:hypothetical protein
VQLSVYINKFNAAFRERRAPTVLLFSLFFKTLPRLVVTLTSDLTRGPRDVLKR